MNQLKESQTDNSYVLNWSEINIWLHVYDNKKLFFTTVVSDIFIKGDLLSKITFIRVLMVKIY